MQQVVAALDRWVNALNRPGDPEATAEAVADDVVLERYGTGPWAGQQVERLEGAAAVAGWLARSPEGVRFEVEPPDPRAAVEEPGVVEVRYRVILEDFVNHGTWRLRLADDGRIAWLEHVPDEVPDEYL
ncbi:MAG: nuclear transport factor 2 family protein [Myxococcota bacterium]